MWRLRRRTRRPQSWSRRRGPGAAARPPRRGRRAIAVRPGEQVDPDDLVDRLVAGRLSARVPGGAPGRGRGAGLDRRRLPVDRRRPGAHRPVGRRGRPAVRVLGGRPAPRRRRRGQHLPGPRAAAHRRRARARPSAGRRAAVGPRAVGAAGRGPAFDGMESWLPWLGDDEHLSPTSCPTRARSCSSSPAHARPGAGAAGRGGRPGATLAATWGAATSATSRPVARRSTGCSPTRAARVDRSRRPTGPNTQPSPRPPSIPWSATPTRSPRRLQRARGRGHRVVLAAEGAGSARTAADVLAGDGLDAGRG